MELEDVDCIGQLLRCSERELTREKQVCVNNWDEVRSWKSVSPMGVYKKSKKKNNIQKKRSQPVVTLNKVGNYSVTLSPSGNNVCPLRYRFSDSGKMAYSSTNVLSYNSPSWRNIVDWKTYEYVERTDPGIHHTSKMRKANLSGTHSLAENLSPPTTEKSSAPSVVGNPSYHKMSASEYSLLCRMNPSDVIDDKIATAYVESLSFDMDNFDEEELRRNLILRPVVRLPVASVNDGNLTRLVAKPRTSCCNILKKKQRVNAEIGFDLCIQTTKKPKPEQCAKKCAGCGARKRNKKKRRGSDDQRREVVKLKKAGLPPIPRFRTTKQRSEEFATTFAQMMAASNSTSNFEKRLTRWKDITDNNNHNNNNNNNNNNYNNNHNSHNNNHNNHSGRNMMSSSETNESKSADFYLPTLKYGNYVHLFKDGRKNDDGGSSKSDAASRQKSDVMKKKSDVKLPKVIEMQASRLTTSTYDSSSFDSL